jgi:hypothetical protein
MPKEATYGSYFGGCSCGVDKRDGVPCDHMAAIVKSARVPVLKIFNIMPYWWTRKTWQLQFPLEEELVCNVRLEQTKATRNRDNFLRYCPTWSAPNKAGRPKKGERRKSGIEIAMGKRGAKKPCKLRLYVANDCWKDPQNVSKRPDTWKDEDELIEEIGMGIDENVIVHHEDGLEERA